MLFEQEIHLMYSSYHTRVALTANMLKSISGSLNDLYTSCAGFPGKNERLCNSAFNNASLELYISPRRDQFVQFSNC